MPIKRLPGKVLFVLICALWMGSIFPVYAQENEPIHWLYLRAGQPLTAQETPVELIAVGDIMMGRTVKANARTLEKIAPLLGAADLAVGNFEGVLAPRGKDPGALSQIIPNQPYHLVMGRQVPSLLQSAGFDLLSLANNHSLDLKTSGLMDTSAALEAHDLAVIGVNPEPGVDQAAVIREIRGVKIAFLAFSTIPTAVQSTTGPVPARYDPEKSDAAVRAARQSADVVIVNMHWGVEYQTRPEPAQRRAAENLYAAGADLIIGHHPHVVQGTALLTSPDSQREAGFVAYSLGNFVFDQFAGETLQGLALRVLIDKHGVRGVEALPLQAATHPRLLTSQEATHLFTRLQPDFPSTVGFTCDLDSCQQSPLQSLSKGGRFSSSQIDLTGDGKPETIRLADEKISITAAGETVWTSPAEWQVLDLALGDPNDDGRAELLISLRKPDRQGILRSHPFIVGYRGGMYKLLWGGSALSSPITEVELGDVDGDGTDELVVLEEQAGVSRSVSVLDWHGWGFLLKYRSAPGFYQDLTLEHPASSLIGQIVVSLFYPDQGQAVNKVRKQ